eukprot:TRINITY_DN1188_c0_g1_i2.p1 TRINITY_DN1188_c0_g1~~TRINITY_DN1188_c0_g1_i2.p1  ORF type:complete len:1034 (-),score=257.72 TRINITY_DN1188_c0_g1_i2:514-3264(-)
MAVSGEYHNVCCISSNVSSFFGTAVPTADRPMQWIWAYRGAFSRWSPGFSHIVGSNQSYIAVRTGCHAVFTGAAIDGGEGCNDAGGSSMRPTAASSALGTTQTTRQEAVRGSASGRTDDAPCEFVGWVCADIRLERLIPPLAERSLAPEQRAVVFEQPSLRLIASSGGVNESWGLPSFGLSDHYNVSSDFRVQHFTLAMTPNALVRSTLGRMRPEEFRREVRAERDGAVIACNPLMLYGWELVICSVLPLPTVSGPAWRRFARDESVWLTMTAAAAAVMFALAWYGIVWPMASVRRGMYHVEALERALDRSRSDKDHDGGLDEETALAWDAEPSGGPALPAGHPHHGGSSNGTTRLGRNDITLVKLSRSDDATAPTAAVGTEGDTARAAPHANVGALNSSVGINEGQSGASFDSHGNTWVSMFTPRRVGLHASEAQSLCTAVMRLALSTRVMEVFGLAQSLFTMDRHLRTLRAQREAAHAARARQQAFLANMSHDIRNPVHGLLGLAEALWDDPTLPPSARVIAGTFLDTVDHIRAMLTDILDFSRLAAGRVAMNPAPFHATAAVRAVARLFEATAQRKRLTISVDEGADTMLAMADAARVRQTLHNFGSNAVKYTEHGQVVFAVARAASFRAEDVMEAAVGAGPAGVGADAAPAGGAGCVVRVPVCRYYPPRRRRGAATGAQPVVVMTVRDTGRGIPAASADTIFESYQQVRTQDAMHGAGLGLAIALKLAQQMGGGVGFVSGLRGSAFFLAVPAAADNAAVPPATTMNGVDAMVVAELSRRAKVLPVIVVDDVALNVELTARILQHIGFPVVRCADGQAALEAVRHARPGLVLADQDMPIMTGTDLARVIRADEALAGVPAEERVPIVCTSASATPDAAAEFAAVGMAVLPKPFTRVDLLQVVLRDYRFGAESG